MEKTPIYTKLVDQDAICGDSDMFRKTQYHELIFINFNREQNLLKRR